MTKRSPQPSSKLSDEPPALGLSKKRRGSPTETVATIASLTSRPSLSPWKATLSLPSR